MNWNQQHPSWCNGRCWFTPDSRKIWGRHTSRLCKTYLSSYPRSPHHNTFTYFHMDIYRVLWCFDFVCNCQFQVLKSSESKNHRFLGGCFKFSINWELWLYARTRYLIILGNCGYPPENHSHTQHGFGAVSNNRSKFQHNRWNRCFTNNLSQSETHCYWC
jgi:hypothetical protein